LSNYVFKSQRLGFRNWIETDIPKMVTISSDPDVMEFFPDVATPEQTREFIQRLQTSYNNKGYCYFAVDRLDTNEFIGFIGLLGQNYESEFTPCVDIGWRLGKKHWGLGFATEGARRCLEYGFKELKLPQIISTAPAINRKSIHVMEKIGMTKRLDFIHSRLTYNKRLQNCMCYEARPAD